MNRSALCAALMTLSTAGATHAQTSGENTGVEWYNSPATEKTFTIPENAINFRDFISFDEGTIRLELADVSDYKRVASLDSILRQVKKDIAFYKDSIGNDGSNVRIDYALKYDAPYVQMRFKKYAPDGALFVNKRGDLARLKIERDTINIVMTVKNDDEIKSDEYTMKHYPHHMQVSVYIDDYNNLDKIIERKEQITHAIDTIASLQKKETATHAYFYPSSCSYNMQTKKANANARLIFVKYGGILTRKGLKTNFNHSHIDPHINFGAGLVTNTLAPSAELGISYIDRWRKYLNNDYSFFSVYASGYYFFDRNAAGNMVVNDNWFINADLGSTFNTDILGLKIRGFSVGAGYLVLQKGDHFKGTTLKGFINMPLRQGFTISPEVIFTDNCKQVFPGITVKIFGKR